MELKPNGLQKNPARFSDIFAFGFGDIRVEGYEAHPHIAAKVAV